MFHRLCSSQTYEFQHRSVPEIRSVRRSTPASTSVARVRADRRVSARRTKSARFKIRIRCVRSCASAPVTRSPRTTVVAKRSSRPSANPISSARRRLVACAEAVWRHVVSTRAVGTRCARHTTTIRCVRVRRITSEIRTSSAQTVSRETINREDAASELDANFGWFVCVAPDVPVPSPVPECITNDDCPFHLSCHNQRCVSACLLENTCGRGSFCHVQNHEPVCRCPEGYQGNPLVECRPRKYCLRFPGLNSFCRLRDCVKVSVAFLTCSYSCRCADGRMRFEL